MRGIRYVLTEQIITFNGIHIDAADNKPFHMEVSKQLIGAHLLLMRVQNLGIQKRHHRRSTNKVLNFYHPFIWMVFLRSDWLRFHFS